MGDDDDNDSYAMIKMYKTRMGKGVESCNGHQLAVNLRTSTRNLYHTWHSISHSADGTGHQTTQAAIDRSTTSKQLRTTTTTTSLSSRHLSSSNHTGRLVSDGFQATVSPATQPPETTSEVEAPGPKYWGIEVW